MTRSRAWALVLWLALLGHGPAFGDARSESVAGDAGETPAVVGLQLTIGGVEAVAAVAGASVGVGSASALVNQAQVGNRVDDRTSSRESRIEGSGRDNAGILSINQDSGNLNNQANVRALALVTGRAQVAAIVNALSAWASATATDNTVVTHGAARANVIADSFHRTVGITGVNQAAGSLNQQANVLGLAFGSAVGAPGELMALHDTTLGEVSVARNTIEDQVASRSDTITDAFRDYRGVAQVSQVSGDLNVVRSAVNISVHWIGDALTAPAALPR